MEDVAGKISLYHNLFLVCLALSALCLIIAIIVFFALNIRDVLGYLTGRKAKKAIKELQESNAASGRLMPRERTNMQYVAQEMKEDMGVRGAAVPGARKVDNVVQNSIPQAETWNEQADATELLQESGSVPVAASIPEPTTEQAIVQQSATNDSTAMLNLTNAKLGTFVIEKEIIMIHAEEVI